MLLVQIGPSTAPPPPPQLLHRGDQSGELTAFVVQPSPSCVLSSDLDQGAGCPTLCTQHYILITLQHVTTTQ